MSNFEYAELRSEIKDTKIYDRFSKSYEYGHFEFEGQFSEELYNKLGRWPTENEAIALIDNNKCNFGAACYVSPNGMFDGTINTD